MGLGVFPRVLGASMTDTRSVSTLTFPPQLWPRRLLWATTNPSNEGASGRRRSGPAAAKQRGRARPLGTGTTDRGPTWHSTTTTETTTERQNEMFGSTHENDFDHQKDSGRLATAQSSAMTDRPRHAGRRVGRGTILTRALAAGAGTGALVAALALPAAASGSPNPWEGAQVGLNYPVYQPKTVLAIPQSSFKLLLMRHWPGRLDLRHLRDGLHSPLELRQDRGFLAGRGLPVHLCQPGHRQAGRGLDGGDPERDRQSPRLRLLRRDPVQELHYRIRRQERLRAPVGAAVQIRDLPEEADSNVHRHFPASPCLRPCMSWLA